MKYEKQKLKRRKWKKDTSENSNAINFLLPQSAHAPALPAVIHSITMFSITIKFLQLWLLLSQSHKHWAKRVGGHHYPRHVAIIVINAIVVIIPNEYILYMGCSPLCHLSSVLPILSMMSSSSSPSSSLSS